MIERPILFNGEMVRAILDGRKTQTRRLVQPSPGRQAKWLTASLLSDSPSARIARSHEGDLGAQLDHPRGGPLGWVRCPFGEPGDRLWVRETFSPYLYQGGCWYWADGNEAAFDATRPKPSIHMPRWASRITLEVVSVRVERLNDISEADAKAEGVDDGPGRGSPLYPSPRAARGALGHGRVFRELWDSINGDGAWKQNPWVWAVTFKRVAS